MIRIALLLGLAACGNVPGRQTTDAMPTGDDAPAADGRTGGSIVHVSTTGNDANDGITQPVKTLKRGIGIAVANRDITTISVAAGLYDASNGETFPYTVPGGISIEGPAGGGALLAGGTTAAGLSLDSGTLANLEFEGFTVAITATGTVHITGTRVQTSALAIRAETAAQLTIDSLDIAGQMAKCMIGIELDGGASLVATGLRTDTLATAIVANDHSTVMLGGGMIAGNVDCGFQPGMAVSTTGSVAVADTIFDGGVVAMHFNQPATPVMLTNTTIRNLTNTAIEGFSAVNFTMTGGVLMNNSDVLIALDGTWSFTDVMVINNRGFGALLMSVATLKMRGSTVSQNLLGIEVSDSAVADLGTVADPGGNTFVGNTDCGVQSDGDPGAPVTAVGNTWQPNVQRADELGHYNTVETIVGPVAAAPGNNFVLTAGRSLQR